MIRNFASQSAEDVFNGDYNTRAARKLPREILDRAAKLLAAMNLSTNVDDFCRPPGNKLKPLRGNRSDTWAIRINDQWRLTFKFEAGEYIDVLIEDYH